MIAATSYVRGYVVTSGLADATHYRDAWRAGGAAPRDTGADRDRARCSAMGMDAAGVRAYRNAKSRPRAAFAFIIIIFEPTPHTGHTGTQPYFRFRLSQSGKFWGPDPSHFLLEEDPSVRSPITLKSL